MPSPAKAGKPEPQLYHGCGHDGAGYSYRHQSAGLLSGALPQNAGHGKPFDGEAPAPQMLGQAKSCYVCRRAAEFEQKYISNVVYIWKKDPAFQEKLRAQPYFCLEHAALLLAQGQKDLS